MNDDRLVFDLARYIENFGAQDGAEQYEIWTHLKMALRKILASLQSKGLQPNMQIAAKHVLRFEL